MCIGNDTIISFLHKVFNFPRLLDILLNIICINEVYYNACHWARLTLHR